MALIICPECGKKVSSLATACPDCGYPISQLMTVDSSEEKDEYSNVSEALFQLSKACESGNLNRISSIVEYVANEGKSIYKNIYDKSNELCGNIRESVDLFSTYFRLIYDNLDVESIGTAYFTQSKVRGFYYLSKNELEHFQHYDMFRESIVLLDVKKTIGNKFFIGTISTNMSHVFVLKENVSEYEHLISLYEKYCDSLSSNYYLTKNGKKQYKIGALDICSVNRFSSRKVKQLDERATDEAIRSWESRKQQFESYKRTEMSKATLRRATGMMLMDSNTSKPFSVTTETMIGGAIGGVTGALVGASYGAEKNAQYQRAQQMNQRNQQYRDQANENYRRAQALQYEQFSEPKPDKIYKTVTENDYEVVIDSFVGQIAYIVPEKDNYWIDKKKSTISKMLSTGFDLNDKETTQLKYIKSWWIINGEPCDEMVLLAIDDFVKNREAIEYKDIYQIIKSELGEKVDEIRKKELINILDEKERKLKTLVEAKAELLSSIASDEEADRKNAQNRLKALAEEFDAYYDKAIDEKEQRVKQLEMIRNQYADDEKRHAKEKTHLLEEKVGIESKLKDSKAVFETLQDEANILSQKASKGGLFKKKRVEEFENKQSEADVAKSKVNELENLRFDIVTRIDSESKCWDDEKAEILAKIEKLNQEIKSVEDDIIFKKNECEAAQNTCIKIIEEYDTKREEIRKLEEDICATTDAINEFKRQLEHLSLQQ